MRNNIKRAALQIAVMAVIIAGVRFSFDGMIAQNWLIGLSIFIAMLFNTFVIRPFCKRQWPDPKQGWAE